MLFALARACERKGQYAETLEVAAEANAMLAVPYDRQDVASRFDAIVEAFSKQRLAALPRPANSSELPVFIVGMPRTGSTLVERIVHCHPDAYGAGETPALHLLVEDLSMRIGSTFPFPKCIVNLTQDDVTELAQAYLDQVTRHAPRVKRIADKYLGNYRYLGLVNLLFPKARVIHCRRDPVDTCLSCYLERLTPQSAPYATDLGNLGFQYRQYERIMDHWRDVLDVPMMELGYESLVKDQEAVTRQILDFCGLPWHDACLRFHEAERYDNTLSFDQVRRPLYRDSMKRAERFGPLLDPLRRALAGGDES